MQAKRGSLSDFTTNLASAEPTPGGGGASALAGALAAALAAMTARLTAGKKKYAEYENDIQRILKDAEALQGELLACIDEDAVCFEPLSKAYAIPKDDPKRGEVMECALRTACSAPLKIMQLAARAIAQHAELAEKGSAIMVSDVGVGVVLARAALVGASLNIRINAGMMKDEAYKNKLMNELEALLQVYTAIADETYQRVLTRIAP